MYIKQKLTDDEYITKRIQEEIAFRNMVRDKVFCCKKDVQCKNGFFQKGSVVIIDVNESKHTSTLYVSKIYDAADYLRHCFIDKNPNSAICSDELSDLRLSKSEYIDYEKFFDFFEEHKGATALFLELMKKRTPLSKKYKLKKQESSVKNNLCCFGFWSESGEK